MEARIIKGAGKDREGDNYDWPSILHILKKVCQGGRILKTRLILVALLHPMLFAALSFPPSQVLGRLGDPPGAVVPRAAVEPLGAEAADDAGLLQLEQVVAQEAGVLGAGRQAEAHVPGKGVLQLKQEMQVGIFEICVR